MPEKRELPESVPDVLQELAEAWGKLAAANEAVAAADATGSKDLMRAALRWLLPRSREFLRAVESAVEVTTE